MRHSTAQTIIAISIRRWARRTFEFIFGALTTTEQSIEDIVFEDVSSDAWLLLSSN